MAVRQNPQQNATDALVKAMLMQQENVTEEEKDHGKALMYYHGEDKDVWTYADGTKKEIKRK